MKRFTTIRRIILCAALMAIQGAILNAQAPRDLKYVELEKKELELDFVIADGRFTLDGTRAIVWGSPSNDAKRGPSNQAAVLDLEKLEVIAEHRFAAGIRTATINHDHVFVSPESGNLIYRYDHNLEASKRVFTKKPILSLYALPNGKIGYPADIFGGLVTLDAETFEFDFDDDFPAVRELTNSVVRRKTGRDFYPIFTLLPDNKVEMYQQIFDLETGEILRTDFKKLTPVYSDLNSKLVRVAANHRQKIYGRRLESTRIVDHNLIPTYKFPGTVSVRHFFWKQHSTTQPIAHILNQTETKGETLKLLYQAIQLSDGKSLITRILKFDCRSSDAPARIQCFENQMFALVKNRICEFQLPSIPDDQIENTIHIPEFAPPLVDTDQVVEFKIPAKDGQGKLDFQLLCEYPGLTIDRETGLVSIEGAEVWKDHVATLERSRIFQYRNLLDRFESQIADARPVLYKNALGQELPDGKLPFTIPLHVIVTDEEDQSDSVAMHVVVLGPRADIDEVVVKARQKVLKAPEKKPGLNPARPPLRPKPNLAIPDVDPVARLEERIRALEELLESVNQQLEEANQRNAKD